MKLEDLKVGMFARTKDGLIRKITYKVVYPSGGIICGIDKLYISEEPEYHDEIIFEDIIKASFNIIDLIKKGDILEVLSDLHDLLGNDVFRVRDENHLKHLKHGFDKGYFHLISIITKEQMEQMSYRLGE